MYPSIQNVAKFRSKCEKYKMDFYPELDGTQVNSNGKHFIGLFKELTEDGSSSDSNIKTYMYKQNEPLPYIYISIFSENVKVELCEVVFN